MTMRSSLLLVLFSLIVRSGSPLSIAKKPIRWGIVSAGRISADYVQAISLAEGAEATAVAARSPTAAAKFASQYKIPNVYNSYADLIHSSEVDVVYIGTIADQHVELTRDAILAGTPVVVEKPMALCAQDAEMLIHLAREKDVFLMEGMWTRCFPAMKKLRQILASDEIGRIIYIQGDFGYNMINNPPDDRIWLPTSGGITLDVGMYIAQFGRIAFPGGKVKHVHASGTMKNGVDCSVMATVTYECSENESDFVDQDGMMQFVLTGAANTEERLVLQGTKGRVIVDSPFHTPQRLRVLRDLGRGETSETVHNFPPPEDPYGKWNNPGSIGFVHQIHEVGNALRDGKKQCDCFTWDDSLEVAQILDEVLVQVRTGGR
ncbi:hypothetical protein HJC23_010289 [Cyclotella cryptica]|uniref:D-xylose 1-dehydrogenase (NADP(+), D-xylono-1,5-lactone-forming) n=1 Tax=Cyclotella cryptica TaxID=29204 RepID=A0ABD3QV71_9STRA